MKFDILREDLQAELAAVGSARDKRGNIDAHKGILFEIKDGGLTLTAVNPEYSISKTLNLNMGYYDENFSFVAGDEFIRIIDKLGGDSVTVEFEDDKNTVELRCGKFKCKQSVIPAEKYIVKRTEGECMGTQTLKAESLKEMIESVICACASIDCSVDMVRTGVKMTASDGMIEIVALDGCRIAVAAGKYDGNIDIILSGKMLKETMKLMNGDVEIKQYANCYVIDAGEYTMLISALEGIYPDWKKIKPREVKGEFIARRIELLNAAERLKTVSNGEQKPLVLEISKGKLEISLETRSGSGAEKVDITAGRDIADVKVGLSCTHIIDALKSIKDDEIVVEYESEVMPVVISNKANDRIHTIMPVRISAKV